MSFTSLQNSSVVIQQKTNSGNSFDPVWTWATYATLDATRDLLSEKEQPRKEGNVSLADTVFFTDYTSGVTNEMRLVYNSENYEIYQVHNPNDMNRHLEIKCKKMQPGEV